MNHKTADRDGISRAMQLEFIVVSHNRIDTDTSGESDGGVPTCVLVSGALRGIELDLVGTCLSAQRAFDGCQKVRCTVRDVTHWQIRVSRFQYRRRPFIVIQS